MNARVSSLAIATLLVLAAPAGAQLRQPDGAIIPAGNVVANVRNSPPLNEGIDVRQDARLVPEVFTGTDGTQRHALTFGAQKINLHQVGEEFAPHAKEPKAGSADLCFLISGDVKQAKTELEAKGVRIEEGPIKRTGARGPILSIYLRDPDSNLIELSEQLEA